MGPIIFILRNVCRRFTTIAFHGNEDKEQCLCLVTRPCVSEDNGPSSARAIYYNRHTECQFSCDVSHSFSGRPTSCTLLNIQLYIYEYKWLWITYCSFVLLAAFTTLSCSSPSQDNVLETVTVYKY